MSELVIHSANPAAATGCLLSDLRQGVRSMMRDSGGTYISDEMIDGWLNEAQRDIATRLHTLQVETTGITGSNSTIPMPGNLVVLHWLKLDGATNEVQFVDDATYMSYLDQGASLGVTLGRIFAEQIELYPAANTTAYTLRYEYDPSEMVSDTDRSALPRQFCPRMMNYARAHGFYTDGDGSMGDRYMALYESGLPNPSLGRQRLNPGPFSLGRELGPFDTTDARHV